MHIKTPLLWVIVNIYGHLGYQLCPLTRNWRSWFHFAVNLAVNCLLFYYIFVLDTFEFKSIVTLLQIQKPFFTLLLRIFFLYGNFGLMLLNILYFSFFGHRIVVLLDSPHFTQVYHSKRQTWRILAYGIAGNTALFMSFHFTDTYQMLKNPSFPSLLSLFVHYVISTLHFFTFILLLYQQYATKTLLARLEMHQLTGSQDLLKEIKELALVSGQIVDYLAFPLATFLLVSLENLIVVTCMTVFFYEYAALLISLHLFYPALAWACMLYLARLNGQVMETFKRICKCKSRFTLCASELSIYESSFQLRLFSLICFDVSFLLSTLLFALSYTVFLIQTN